MKTRRSILALSAACAFCGSLWLATTHQAKEVKAEPASGYHVPKIVDFACGEYHNLAIDSDGNLWQWGGRPARKRCLNKSWEALSLNRLPQGLNTPLP